MALPFDTTDTYYGCSPKLYVSGNPVPRNERRSQFDAIKIAGFDLNKRFNTKEKAQKFHDQILEKTGIDVEVFEGFGIAF